MTRRGTSTLLVLAVLAPWATLLPLTGAPSVLAHVLTLVAACHGAGLALGSLARRPAAHALLTIQWGLGTLVAISGALLLLGINGRASQTILVCAFAALHSALVAIRFRGYRERLQHIRVEIWWVVPFALLSLFAIVHVLGAAGDLGARPFDDDGHLAAQLQRMRDTGSLGDPIGYARSSQLGGQLVLTALATLPGDVHALRLIEAIAFVLALGLVCARIHPRDATTAMWATLVVIAGSAFAFTFPDPTACWTAIGMILALHAMLVDDRPPALLPIAVVAGALITLRHELAPIGITAVLVAWWPERANARRAALVIGGALAVVLPFLLARMLDARSVPAEVQTLLSPSRGSLVVRLAIFVAISAAGIAIVRVVLRARSQRWLPFAAVIVLAGIASQLTGDRPYALRFLWPLVIACGLVILIELSRQRTLSTAALLAALLALVLIQEARDTSGRLRWTRRYLDLANNIEYVRTTGTLAPVAGGYEAILAQLPPNARVATWVTRPERLDYSGPYHLVDLRTPRAARLRVHRFDVHTSRIARLLEVIDADYLLLEADDRHAQRTRASFHYRFVCPDNIGPCVDDLEATAGVGSIVAEAHGLRLVKLTTSATSD